MTLHRKSRWILLAALALATACGSGDGLPGVSGSGPNSNSGSGSGAADPAKMDATATKVCDLLGKDVLERYVPSHQKKPLGEPDLGQDEANGRCSWRSPGAYPEREVFLTIEGSKDGAEAATERYEIEKKAHQSKAGKRMSVTAGLYSYSELQDVAIGDGGYALAHTITGSRAKSTTASIIFHTGPYFVQVDYRGYDLKKGGDATVPADRTLLAEAQTFTGAQAMAESVASALGK